LGREKGKKGGEDSKAVRLVCVLLCFFFQNVHTYMQPMLSTLRNEWLCMVSSE
jgi:hypothetical protein